MYYLWSLAIPLTRSISWHPGQHICYLAGIVVVFELFARVTAKV